MELYLKNIARRWKKEVSKNREKAYIFSPYITSSTAESVLSQVSGIELEIYTLFSAELFSSKASSIKTIKNISNLGHKIFHLPNLHAKIVLMPEVFASVGSQNLTSSGTKNKEASIVVLDKKIISQIHKEIQYWIQERIPVTAEMIDAMENDLAPLEILFQKAISESKKLDKNIFDAQVQRDAEVKRIAIEQEKMLREQEAQKLKEFGETLLLLASIGAEQQEMEQDKIIKQQEQLHAYIQQTLKSSETAVAKVCNINPKHYIDYKYTAASKKQERKPLQNSLIVQNGRDLTSWSVHGITVHLEMRKRYLIMIPEDNGKIGWARVVKTRISFIGQGVNFLEKDKILLDDIPFSLFISVTADWSEERPFNRNIAISVRVSDQIIICTINAWFSIDGLIFTDVNPINRIDIQGYEASYILDIIKKSHQFKEQCLRLIVKPFIYKTHLHGIDAESFFNLVGYRYELKLAMIGEYPILLAKGIYGWQSK